MFGDYVQHVSVVVRSLRSKAGLDEDVSKRATETERSGGRGSGSNAGFGGGVDEYGMEYQPYDWSFFQGALQLMMVVDSLLTRLHSFDKNVRVTLLNQKQKLLYFDRAEFKENDTLKG